MYDVIVGLFQFGILIAAVFLLWFFSQLCLGIYEEVRERSERRIADIVKRENELLLQQVEVRRGQPPVDYPRGSGPHGM